MRQHTHRSRRLLIALFYHAGLGLQVVIEDYVHREWLKIPLLAVTRLGCFALASAGIVATLRIAFLADVESSRRWRVPRASHGFRITIHEQLVEPGIPQLHPARVSIRGRMSQSIVYGADV